jgi:predicted outer membrane protein
MTRMTAAVALSALLLSAFAEAQERPASPPQPAGAKKAYSDAESAAAGAAIQRRNEARQKLWDRQMQSLSRSICTGC